MAAVGGRIRSGCELFSLPFRLLLTANAAGFKSLPSHARLAVRLLRERRRGKESFWQPYLRSLPAAHSSVASRAHADVLSRVRGSLLASHADDFRQTIVDEHAEWCKVDPSADEFTFDDYVWARLTVSSRAFRLRQGETDEILALVPLADMLNHSPTYNSEWGMDPHKELKQGRFRMRARAGGVPSGGEATDSYGDKPNHTLCVYYGFSLPDNPLDATRLTLRAPVSRDTNAGKLRSRLLAERDDETAVVSLRHRKEQQKHGSRGPKPMDPGNGLASLLSFARVAVASEREIHDLCNLKPLLTVLTDCEKKQLRGDYSNLVTAIGGVSHPISADNEVRALELLIAGVDERARGLPVPSHEEGDSKTISSLGTDDGKTTAARERVLRACEVAIDGERRVLASLRQGLSFARAVIAPRNGDQDAAWRTPGAERALGIISGTVIEEYFRNHLVKLVPGVAKRLNG